MKIIVIIFIFCSAIFTPFLEGQVTESLSQVQFYLENEIYREAWQSSAKLQGKLDKNQICQGDPVIRLLHGHTSLALGNYDEAMNQFYCACDTLNSESLIKWRAFCQELVLNQPSFTSSHYLLGDALARLEKYDSANVEFTKAIELSPNNFLALNARGVNEWVWSKLKNEAMCLQCTADWDLALSIKTDMADAFVNKGVGFLLVGGDEEGCISLFQKAINLKSDFSLAYNGIKVAYHTIGNVEGFFDITPFAINTPFAKLDLLFSSPDSITEARGVAKLAMAIPIPQFKIIGAVTYAGATAFDLGNSIDKMINSTPATIHTNQHDFADSLKGGVYSIQIEGINKETFIEGLPSLSGTWFLLNYPSKTWKIN